MLAALSHIVTVGGSAQDLGAGSALGIALVLVVTLFVALVVIGAVASRRD